MSFRAGALPVLHCQLAGAMACMSVAAAALQILQCWCEIALRSDSSDCATCGC